jgi:hypothetical protein
VSRPARIARLVVDRAGGKPVFDLFTAAELRAHYADLEDWVGRVIDAVALEGHHEEGDEDFLILFFDATDLPRSPR